MSMKTDVYLNQVAQCIKPLKEAIEWFANLAEEAQLLVLRQLVFFSLQSGAIGKDVKDAIFLSGLKPTFTPCQLLIKVLNDEPNGSMMLKATLAKVVNLPSSERVKSFRLLIALFEVADRRKRTQGLEPEKYWWHKDLSDEKVVEKILSSG